MGTSLGKQLVNLLQVLVLNVGKEVPTSDIIDVLYSESENPTNVLKFSIFRLRKALKKLEGLEDLDWIVTTKKGYRISDELEYTCDFKQFEDVWHQIEQKNQLTQKEITLGTDLINIYSGHIYLTKNPSIYVTTVNEWYRSKFATTIILVCQELLREEKYEEMLTLDYSAIIKEPFYEGLHYYYMKGLIETKDYHKALQYYDEINEQFYKELGIGLSSRFKELYNVVKEEYNEVHLLSIDEIEVELERNNKKSGGFFCSYEMFKYMYELSIKTGLRENQGYCLILLELKNRNFQIENEIALTNRVKTIIEQSLRTNDIFARVNNSQFIILVNCQTVDNAYIITERISSRFYQKFNKNLYRLQYNVKKV